VHVRELFEEIGITLTVDDLTLLSGAHFRVPLSGSQLYHVYVYAASVHVPFLSASMRTPANVEQAVVAQPIIYHDGTYIVPATLAIDGLKMIK
jgi:8-oxo-dGTP pyrophosphatase MutT (NUDIX family)